MEGPQKFFPFGRLSHEVIVLRRTVITTTIKHPTYMGSESFSSSIVWIFLYRRSWECFSSNNGKLLRVTDLRGIPSVPLTYRFWTFFPIFRSFSNLSLLSTLFTPSPRNRRDHLVSSDDNTLSFSSSRRNIEMNTQRPKNRVKQTLGRDMGKVIRSCPWKFLRWLKWYSTLIMSVQVQHVQINIDGVKDESGGQTRNLIDCYPEYV